VFAVHRSDDPRPRPRVELIEGRGAIGAAIGLPDGSTDVVAFRIDSAPESVTCGPLTSDAAVFAEGLDAAGKLVRQLRIARENN
jgi:hypothetical protein